MDIYHNIFVLAIHTIIAFTDLSSYTYYFYKSFVWKEGGKYTKTEIAISFKLFNIFLSTYFFSLNFGRKVLHKFILYKYKKALI